jgi:hypothetical protein
MMDRTAFLAPLIGEPWAWQSRNCWDFACHVQRELFGRELPRVVVPTDFSKRWVLELIERHPERAAWREVPDGPSGLLAAADGALVLMAHSVFPRISASGSRLRRTSSIAANRTAFAAKACWRRARWAGSG